MVGTNLIKGGTGLFIQKRNKLINYVIEFLYSLNMTERIRRMHTILIIWILAWIPFTVNQISETISHLNASQSLSTFDENSKITESQINKPLEKKAASIVQIDSEKLDGDICLNDEYWASVKAEVAPNKKYITLIFPSEPFKNEIKSIEIIVRPLTINYETSNNAFHMHSISQSQINIRRKEHRFEIGLLNGLDTSYTNLVSNWKLDLIASTYQSDDCYKSTLLEINNSNYLNIDNLEVFYKKNIINPVFEKNYDANEVEEEEYINNFFQKQHLKQLHNNLPIPHEAALALLNKDVEYDFENFRVGTEYTFEDISSRNKLNSEVVVGLFGKVAKEDLIALNRVLQVLNLVAPDLKISYSNNSADINLPIHFADCTRRFSELVNDCKGKYAGMFYHSRGKFDEAKFGWIWVNSQYGSSMRQHILIHELGHALGLGHNLCRNSVMSYAKFADSVPYFTEIDLMQLRILYDPKLDEIYNNYQVIEDLDLNLDTYSEYADNSKPMCSPQQGGWKSFVDFQKGLKPIDEFLSY